ncbi:MAG: DUF262 domain-containing protein [Planctomycetaceae bacterium]|nr:DUF262 domain-containing protein [Planctomycetaceae bacterium]
MTDDIEFEDEAEPEVEEDRFRRFSEAVLYSTDWTVETILSQLRRGNIQLNPNFQRRDAWNNSRKSLFIESIIVGLPIPQLVLAEIKDSRGQYIVLDGKQRLLSLLKFTAGEGDDQEGFALSGLQARPDLARIRYKRMEEEAELKGVLNAFLNYTIRTVIIRNWPNRDFLYQVFLRLNTQSVKLSPQELRQAIAPGPFTTFADDFSADSMQIQRLIGRTSPDPRMRDVEILVRYLAFQNWLTDYRGRMKDFLDDTCARENYLWNERQERVRIQAEGFALAIDDLYTIFGERLARKPNSRSFNRALFDALSYYAAIPDVSAAMRANQEALTAAYDALFLEDEFKEAIESDTAGLPNTVSRVRRWGETLNEICGLKLHLPHLAEGRITVDG